MSEFREKAIEKLQQETKDFKGDKYGQAVYKAVALQLTDFCRQDDEFAQAVVQNGKTLSECCAEITKGCGMSMSDLDAYKKAVAFYFPGADIKCSMTINLCASVEREAEKSHGIILNLEDFL